MFSQCSVDQPSPSDASPNLKPLLSSQVERVQGGATLHKLEARTSLTSQAANIVNTHLQIPEMDTCYIDGNLNDLQHSLDTSSCLSTNSALENLGAVLSLTNQSLHNFHLEKKHSSGDTKDLILESNPSERATKASFQKSTSPVLTKTVRKNSNSGHYLRPRNSLYQIVNDLDNQCDIVYISKHITECQLEPKKSVSLRENARKSTRGHRCNEEYWELKTVRTLVQKSVANGKGNWPPLIPESINLVTPKQPQSVPESDPLTNSLFLLSLEEEIKEVTGLPLSLEKEMQEATVQPLLLEKQAEKEVTDRPLLFKEKLDETTGQSLSHEEGPSARLLFPPEEEKELTTGQLSLSEEEMGQATSQLLLPPEDVVTTTPVLLKDHSFSPHDSESVGTLDIQLQVGNSSEMQKPEVVLNDYSLPPIKGNTENESAQKCSQNNLSYVFKNEDIDDVSVDFTKKRQDQLEETEEKKAQNAKNLNPKKRSRKVFEISDRSLRSQHQALIPIAISKMKNVLPGTHTVSCLEINASQSSRAKRPCRMVNIKSPKVVNLEINNCIEDVSDDGAQKAIPLSQVQTSTERKVDIPDESENLKEYFCKRPSQVLESLVEEENQDLLTSLNAKYEKVHKGWVQLEREVQPSPKPKSKADRLKEIWKSKRRIRRSKALEQQKLSPVQMLFMKTFSFANICRWFLETTETRSLVIVKKINTRLASETQPFFHNPSSIVTSSSNTTFTSLQAERLKKHLKKFAMASPAKNNLKTLKQLAKSRQLNGQINCQNETITATRISTKPRANPIPTTGTARKQSQASKSPASARILRKYSNIRGKLQVSHHVLKTETSAGPLSKTGSPKSLVSQKPSSRSEGLCRKRLLPQKEKKKKQDKTVNKIKSSTLNRKKTESSLNTEKGTKSRSKRLIILSNKSNSKKLKKPLAHPGAVPKVKKNSTVSSASRSKGKSKVAEASLPKAHKGAVNRKKPQAQRRMILKMAGVHGRNKSTKAVRLVKVLSQQTKVASNTGRTQKKLKVVAKKSSVPLARKRGKELKSVQAKRIKRSNAN
uniref:Uncharacterized protein n=1 Tax=Erpetoichthys calabaricus TaxID=27687 RepID=A0A8C4RJK1_ERPCA